jgi:DNA-binding MarR family transcriptional regulator
MPVKPSETPAQRSTDHTADAAMVASLLTSSVWNLKSAGRPPQELREAVERAALGKRHGRALLGVAAAGPISVSDLAKRLGLLLSTTSTLVGELSRAGLLVRTEDEDDRRRTIVCLHEDYREAMSAWLELSLQPIRETLARLSPAAREHFIDGLRLLSEQTAQSAAGRPEAECD